MAALEIAEKFEMFVQQRGSLAADLGDYDVTDVTEFGLVVWTEDDRRLTVDLDGDRFLFGD